MKKVLAIILVIILFAGASYFNHNYIRKNCEVIQINDGFATAIDECGEMWDFQADDLKVGDKVNLKMNDSLTSNNIYDDVVVDVVVK